MESVEEIPGVEHLVFEGKGVAAGLVSAIASLLVHGERVVLARRVSHVEREVSVWAGLNLEKVGSGERVVQGEKEVLVRSLPSVMKVMARDVVRMVGVVPQSPRHVHSVLDKCMTICIEHAGDGSNYSRLVII